MFLLINAIWCYDVNTMYNANDYVYHCKVVKSFSSSEEVQLKLSRTPARVSKWRYAQVV